MPEIHPTHTCFDDGPDYLLSLITDNPALDIELMRRYLIVHGIYTVPKLIETGKPGKIAHGWLLDTHEDSAVQDGYLDGNRITYWMPIDEFYQHYKPVHETRYTLAEWLDLNEQHNHFGPFREECLALCRRNLVGCSSALSAMENVTVPKPIG